MLLPASSTHVTCSCNFPDYSICSLVRIERTSEVFASQSAHVSQISPCKAAQLPR